MGLQAQLYPENDIKAQQVMASAQKHWPPLLTHLSLYYCRLMGKIHDLGTPYVIVNRPCLS